MFLFRGKDNVEKKDPVENACFFRTLQSSSLGQSKVNFSKTKVKTQRNALRFIRKIPIKIENACVKKKLKREVAIRP